MVALLVTEVSQQAARMRRIEMPQNANPMRGYLDPALIEQHHMLDRVNAHNIHHNAHKSTRQDKASHSINFFNSSSEIGANTKYYRGHTQGHIGRKIAVGWTCSVWVIRCQQKTTSYIDGHKKNWGKRPQWMDIDASEQADPQRTGHDEVTFLFYS